MAFYNNILNNIVLNKLTEFNIDTIDKSTTSKSILELCIFDDNLELLDIIINDDKFNLNKLLKNNKHYLFIMLYKCSNIFINIVLHAIDIDLNIGVMDTIDTNTYENDSVKVNIDNNLLHTAIKLKRYKVVSLLFDNRNIDVNFISNTTVINSLIINGRYKLVRKIMNHPRFDKTIVDVNNLTPMECAIDNRQYKIINILFDTFDHLNNQTTLKILTDYKLLKLFLNNSKFNINKFGLNERHILILAIIYGDIKNIKLILEHPKIGSIYENRLVTENALNVALKYKQYEIFELIIKSTIWSKFNYIEPIIKLIDDNNIELLKNIRHGSIFTNNIKNDDKYSIIYHCIKRGRVEIFQIMIKILSIQHEYDFGCGNTLLLVAVTFNNFDIVEIILNTFKININRTNDRVETALFIATRSNSHKIVGLLLTYDRINVNILNWKYEDLLLIGIYTNSFESIKLIVDSKKIKLCEPKFIIKYSKIYPRSYKTIGYIKRALDAAGKVNKNYVINKY